MKIFTQWEVNLILHDATYMDNHKLNLMQSKFSSLQKLISTSKCKSFFALVHILKEKPFVGEMKCANSEMRIEINIENENLYIYLL